MGLIGNYTEGLIELYHYHHQKVAEFKQLMEQKRENEHRITIDEP